MHTPYILKMKVEQKYYAYEPVMFPKHRTHTECIPSVMQQNATHHWKIKKILKTYKCTDYKRHHTYI